jgi:hypothetical protein
MAGAKTLKTATIESSSLGILWGRQNAFHPPNLHPRARLEMKRTTLCLSFFDAKIIAQITSGRSFFIRGAV